MNVSTVSDTSDLKMNVFLDLFNYLKDPGSLNSNNYPIESHRFSVFLKSLINFKDRVDFEVSQRLGL